MPLTDPQVLIDAAATRRRSIALWMASANVVAALLLALLVWQVLQRSHRAVEDQAKAVADGLATVVQLNIQSELGTVDAVIRAASLELERLMVSSSSTDRVLNEVLLARHKLLKGVEAVRLTDADGLVKWGTSLPSGAPVDVSDREYFLEAKRLAVPDTVIAGPLKSRVSGNWVVAFLHPLCLNGRFAGAVYVTINANHFRHMFERYDLEALDAVTLRSKDLRLVARHSPGSASQGEVGDAAVSRELLAALASNPRSGNFASQVIVDGEERTTSYRAVDSWPFVVLAGVNNARFFKPWLHEAWTIASMAGLVWLLLVASTWLLHRARRREESAMMALAEQGIRIRALLRAAGDGIHVTNSSGHLVEMSDSFAEMLNSSRDALLGRHISSWDLNQDRAAVDAWLAKLRSGDSQRVEVKHRRDDGTVIDVELQLSAAEIAGQLFVFASSRDVTTERRLMREQKAMLDSDLVGMVKIQDRTITWRNAAAERMLGYGAGELQGKPASIVYWDQANYERVGIEGYASLRDQGHYRSQIRMRRKSGEPVWIDFSAVPLSSSETFAMLVDITHMREVHDALSHAACHDALTGLPNRVLLDDRIRQAQALARREGKGVAVCFLDLDGFKAVNDDHGHDAGDQLLKSIADRLLATIRPSDTAARLGGDEFVLVLGGVSPDDWKPVLNRIIQVVGEPVSLASGRQVNVGVTAGVAQFHADDHAEPHELIERADRVMLQGKRAGKGQVFSE